MDMFLEWKTADYGCGHNRVELHTEKGTDHDESGMKIQWN
jgi:hypothetical protein